MLCSSTCRTPFRLSLQPSYSDFGKSLCTYKMCWKWYPRASIQAWTRLILFANTLCRSAFEMFLMNAVIAVFSSLSVRVSWSPMRAWAITIHDCGVFDLMWFICFYYEVFRGNNGHTLMCCTQIATQYTTHLYKSNFRPRKATTKATA
jgi:hypothetical protein